MNFLISITLITLMLNQVICESSNDDPEKHQRNHLKYYYNLKTHSPNYVDLFPTFNLLDYCGKVLSTFRPNDDSIVSYDSKTVNRLNKRHSNDIYDGYKMDNYQEEKREKDDLKIFRNLFLGSRG